jgi:myxalamid-type polyketide synthase MxaC
MASDNPQPAKDVMVRALREIRELKAQLAATRQEQNEPIAVIGLACRFPGAASTPDAYWHLLQEGVNAIRQVPDGRWDVEALYDADPQAAGKMITKMGGFLDHVAGFDPVFFGIAPREVASMDPQHRLALEVSWEALEQAGLTAEQLLGSQTGVFMGIATNDYAHLLLTQTGLEDIDAYSLTGNSPNVSAGRIAYVLGLQGPTMAIDTACSSSLVAVHLACQSLRHRECDAALAGGVNLLLSPVNTIAFSRMNAMAPDGLCKTFDARANGYTRGEGCGVIVLKRLSDAVAAGDNVLAVIRGSAVNQDGRSSGLTVPHGPSQQAVMRRALQQAGVAPGTVGYVEAHGTGTPLGDPLELQSLGAVYGEGRDPDRPLLVGSVKTNFGHLEAAAGIAGLIKVVLALKQGQVPPHLHFQEPTPRVDWSRLPLQVPTAVTDWPPIDGRRLAGVSSFGFSGTNAHIVVEEGPVVSEKWEVKSEEQEVERESAALFTLSAKSETQLNEMAARMVDYLGREDTPSLAAICYTSQVRRSHWNWRLALLVPAVGTPAGGEPGQTITADNADGNRLPVKALRQKLAAYVAGEKVDDLWVGELRPQNPLKTTFFFSGQGGQRAGMGAELYRTQPHFRRAFDDCARAAEPYLTRPLSEHCFGDDSGGAIADPVAAQVALFALQISLARLWQAWGVEPAVVLGQSMGEYAAAVIAGVFDLATAVGLVAERARLMAAQPAAGAMAVIFTDPVDLNGRLARYPDRVWLAGQNGPRELVVAGYAPDIARLLAACAAAGIKTRTLRALAHTGIASHTPLMQPVMDALAPRLMKTERQRPSLDYISSYTGALADEELATAGYWLAQSRQPFNFGKAVSSWLEQGSTAAVEIGPTSGTLGVARRCVPEAAVHWLPSMRENENENRQLLVSLAVLYVNGAAVNWVAFHGDRRHPPADLPFTSFQRERYWLPEKMARRLTPINADSFAADQANRSVSARLLGHRIPSPLAAVQFAAVWDGRSLDFLADHLVYDTMVVAGAAHLLRVLSGARALFGDGPLTIKETLFARPLILDESEPRQVQLVFQSDSPAVSHFQISSLSGNGTRINTDDHGSGDSVWIEHVTGQVGREEEIALLVASDSLDLLRARCQEEITAAAFYDGLRQRHYQLGPTFRWLEAIWRGEGEVIAQVRPPQTEDGDYLVPPGLLDACLQLLSAAGPSEELPTYVPYSIDYLRFRRRPAGSLWCHATLRSGSQPGQTMVGDICLFDEAGDRLIEIAGLHARPIAQEHLRRALEATAVPRPENVFFEIQWQPQPPAAQNGPADGRWLILTDESGVGAALAGKLPACLLVQPGNSYNRVNKNTWQIRPDVAADYEQLLAEIAAEDKAISGILHLWGLRPARHDDDWLAAQLWGCDSLLLLLQALAANTAIKSHLYTVTAATQPVTSETYAAVPWHAGLWGLGAVAANEHPDLWGGLVDLAADNPSAMAAMIWQEIGINDGEDRVAWRDGRRYVARLAALPGGKLSMPADRAPGSKPYSPDATYLITGGLGVLGLRLASWLAAQGVGHLVLLGRRSPDEAASRQIEGLRHSGVNVLVRPVDVTDGEALTAVFATINERMPPVRGVFHLAGILDDATLQQESPDHLHRVMAPKIQAAWHLHRLTEEMALDHFVLFSSAAAVLGGPGQGAYAAANAAIDGLAHYRRARGLAALSLNWGAWREGGLAEGERRDAGRWQAWGIRSLDPADGLRYLAIALAQPWTQAVIMPWDLTAVTSRAAALPPFFSQLAPSPASERSVSNQWREQLEKAPASQRRMLLIQQMQAQARRTLRLPANVTLENDRPLHELGLDSLMAVELRNAVAELTGESLPVTLLFDYPSIGEMADYLLVEVLDFGPPPADEGAPDKLAAEIEALSEEEALARLLENLNVMRE